MLGFIGVPPFETQSQFKYWIGDPAKKRKDYAFKRLRQLVKATCLRRTKANAESTLKLPKKEEINQVLDLGPDDRELYNFFKHRAATAVRNIEKSSKGNNPNKRQNPRGSGSWSGDILPLIHHLQRICDHGEDLLPTAALQAWRDRDIDSIDWQLIAMGSQKCNFCKTEIEEGNDMVPVELACGHIICTNCHAAEDTDGIGSSHASCLECSGRSPLPTPSQDSISEDYRPSVKIEALLQNLRNEHSTQPKGEDKNAFKRYRGNSRLA